jgi:hypothetical protein
MEQTAPLHRFQGLDEAAAAAEDVAFRHLCVTIEDRDAGAFNRRFSRLLDDLARVKAHVRTMSTTAIADDDGRLWVAHLVVTMDAELIASFASTETGDVPATAQGPDRLIGFDLPPRDTEDGS